MSMEMPGGIKVGTEGQILEKRLADLGIDLSETEKVVEEAVLLFGEGRPEHEVEVIVEALFRKIAAAEALADSPAE
jgi:hypothetical protein